MTSAFAMQRHAIGRRASSTALVQRLTRHEAALCWSLRRLRASAARASAWSKPSERQRHGAKGVGVQWVCGVVVGGNPVVGVMAPLVVGVPPPPPPPVPPPPRVVVCGGGTVVVVGAVVLVVVVQGSLGVVPVVPPLVPPPPRVVGVVGLVVVAGAVVLVVVAQGSLAVLAVVMPRPQAAAATPRPRTRHKAVDARRLRLTAKLRRRCPSALEYLPPSDRRLRAGGRVGLPASGNLD